MIRKFHSAYEAAEYAATITNRWTDTEGKAYDVKNAKEYMKVADESDPLDTDDLSAYYFVNSQGDIGLTSDDGETVMWVFRSSNSRATSRPTAKPERPKPIEDTQQPKSGTTRTKRAVGYSPNIHSKEFIETVEKNKRRKAGCAKAAILAPFIIPIYTYFSDGAFGTGFVIALVISAIMLVIYLFISAKERMEKPWEGVVVKKERKTKFHIYKPTKQEREEERKHLEDHDIITIKRDDGKTHKIDEISNDPKSHSFDYLEIGDRVCYHANMGLLYPYEKYDKTQDQFVVCAFCRNIEPIKYTHCTHCKKILLN